MKNIKLHIKNRTNLIVKLEKIYNISYYKELSFFDKLTMKSKVYPDIYFHQGSLDANALELIENSKITIVNSFGVKKLIKEKIVTLNMDKIKIIYPYPIVKKEYDKQIKKDFKIKYNIHKDESIILFTATDLNKSGIQYLIKLLNKLYSKKFKVVVESTKKQIDTFGLQLNRMKLEYEMILLSDYEDKDELFIASDIFVFPTQQKLFVPNVLKAMYYRNAVFLPDTNFTAEIIDNFSVMRSLEDPSTSFRVDSLLMTKKELRKIQKENEKETLKFSFESRMQTIVNIIEEMEK